MKDDFDVVTGPAQEPNPRADYISGTNKLVGDPAGSQTHGPRVPERRYDGEHLVPEDEFNKRFG